MKKPWIILLLLAAGLSARGQYALPCVSVTNLRASAGHSSELVSQTLMGTPLRVLADKGQWLSVETPEGYRGFVIANTLSRYSASDLERWQQSPRVVVSSVDQSWIYDSPEDFSPSRRVSDVVPGDILQIGGEPAQNALPVALPDGRKGWVRTCDVTPLRQWVARADSAPADSVVAIAPSMTGTPYLWGGASVKGADCSGYTQQMYYRQGILLPRDASQQARVGTLVIDRKPGQRVTENLLAPLKPGDLLFFGNSSTGRVTHVGIYIGEGRIIHCSGRVKINSLLEGKPGYDSSLNLLSARRIEGESLQRLAVKSRPIYGIGR